MMFHGVKCCGIDYNSSFWVVGFYVQLDVRRVKFKLIKLEMDYNSRLNLDLNLLLSKRPPDCVVVQNIELLHRTRADCRVCNNNSFFCLN